MSKETEYTLLATIINGGNFNVGSSLFAEASQAGVCNDSFTDHTALDAWQALEQVDAKNIELDETHVLTHLQGKGKDVESFFALMEFAQTATQIALYIEQVLEAHTIRQINKSARIAQERIKEGTPAAEIIGELDVSIRGLSSFGDKTKSVADSVDEFIDDLFSDVDESKYIPTGVNSYDVSLNRGGFGPAQLCLIAARPACGKCLGVNTPVRMFDGSVKMVQDIATGDLLMGPDSKPRKVLSTTTGQEEMFWIKQNHGEDYRVNKSHILSLKASGSEGSRVHGATVNLEVGDYINKSKKFQMRHKGWKTGWELPERDLQLDPYILGVWLGDGTTLSGHITNNEPEIIEHCQNYAKEQGFLFTKYYDKRNNCLTFNMPCFKSSKDSIQYRLRSLDLIGNKHIPVEYLRGSMAQRLQLLAGFLDTDGHMKGNIFEITQKYEHLCDSLVELANSVGLYANKQKKIATCNGKEFLVYRVHISGNTSIIPNKVERRKAFTKRNHLGYLATGINVESDGYGQYYGFTIDGDRLFLLGDGTVTHNTAFALNIAWRAAKNGSPIGFFSLEMETSELMGRMLSMETNVPMTRFRDKLANKEQAQKLKKAVESSKKWPLHIKDDVFSLPMILAIARNWHRRHGIKAVIIDYCQLIRCNAKIPREQQVATISRECKLLAKSLKVPVILLAQINRESEKEAREPRASDLRESGALEQDADSITFLYLEPEDDKNGNEVRWVRPKQRGGIGYAKGKMSFIRQVGLMGDLI